MENIPVSTCAHQLWNYSRWMLFLALSSTRLFLLLGRPSCLLTSDQCRCSTTDPCCRKLCTILLLHLSRASVLVSGRLPRWDYRPVQRSPQSWPPVRFIRHVWFISMQLRRCATKYRNGWGGAPVTARVKTTLRLGLMESAKRGSWTLLIWWKDYFFFLIWWLYCLKLIASLNYFIRSHGCLFRHSCVLQISTSFLKLLLWRALAWAKWLIFDCYLLEDVF